MGRGPIVQLFDTAARTLDEARRLPPREFLALQLVRVAHALHDADHLEHVTVPATAGLVEILVQGDEYGSGVISVAGDLAAITHEDLASEDEADDLLHRAHCCAPRDGSERGGVRHG